MASTIEEEGEKRVKDIFDRDQKDVVVVADAKELEKPEVEQKKKTVLISTKPLIIVSLLAIGLLSRLGYIEAKKEYFLVIQVVCLLIVLWLVKNT
jgi:SpoU rRNA methylase family enzyme